jgi:hypothetical protein
MTQYYHTPIPLLAPANAATLRSPFGELDAAIYSCRGQGTAFPGTPSEGDRFWRTDLNKLYVYNGTGWDALAVVGAAIDASIVTYSPSTPADWDGGVDPGNQDDANDQLAERVKDLEGVTLDYPCRAYWFHDTDFVIAGNAITGYVYASQQYNGYYYQEAATNNNNFKNSCVLNAGAYTMRLLGVTSSGYGKLDISFKNVLDVGYTSIVTGMDWYTAGTVYNAVKTSTFTIVTPGRHIFDFKVNGKNGSSSGYAIVLTKIDIYLTAGDS